MFGVQIASSTDKTGGWGTRRGGGGCIRREMGVGGRGCVFCAYIGGDSAYGERAYLRPDSVVLAVGSAGAALEMCAQLNDPRPRAFTEKGGIGLFELHWRWVRALRDLAALSH